jgi:hypothetical protein
MIKKGKMYKKPWLMTPAERAIWSVKMQAEAREYLFSIGQPLVYKRDNRYVAEYANGSVKIIE